nr:MAG TPA: immunity protein [Caudoviricetes sp.]
MRRISSYKNMCIFPRDIFGISISIPIPSIHYTVISI